MESKRRFQIWLFVATLLFFSSCGNTVCQPPLATTYKFTLPDIPMMISDAQQRKEYLVTHYWDNYDFADSLLVSNDSITGVAIAGYIEVLSMIPDTLIKSKAVATLLSNTLDNHVFNKFIGQIEHYLYNPNSPMRDEELYLLFVKYIVHSDDIAIENKKRYIFLEKMLLKNRVGELSTDFTYTLKDGSSSRLYSLKSAYTILFFNNPDCEDCGRVKEHISNSDIIGSLYESGKISILGLYSESDLEAWHKGDYPSMIINSYDKDLSILDDNLYDLKAIPTLYLLDIDKRVILKDASIEKIERWLAQE